MLGVWLLLACNCFILRQQECHRFYAKKVYFCRRKVVKDFRRKILRGKQVRILYSTRCCEFRERERQHVTVARREDAAPGTSQKTCHVVLLSLREVGGCKRDPNRALRSNIDRSILSNP